MAAAQVADPNDKQEMIVQTFKKFDKNKDGFISRQELAAVFKALGQSKFKDSDIETLMSAADTNKDGKISYQEFVGWVMSGKKPSSEKGTDPSSPKFAPIDKRGSMKVDYKVFLPERFSVDVNSRFALDKLTIGEGGYGKVFVAKDKEFDDRMVAIKKVTATGNCSTQTEALKSEIKIMKELDHPNICKLLGTFEQGRDMYFIMELCEGGELFDRIIEEGRGLDQKFSADIVKQVSSGLFYAHSRGIAHRDIKPENVVFCTKNSNQVKLIDWGLAISFLGSSMTSAVGSFTYAAPEVIESNNVTAYTAKCDLWSLGVLTYVMLSGKPPFWGNHAQFVAKQKKEQYPMKGDPWDKMPSSAKDFIKKLLKADPEQRLAMDKVVVHDWLATANQIQTDEAASKDVLQNLKHFSGASTFERLCITAVARQLDHKNLTGIHQVFREMDANGDGVLSLKEVQSGFSKIFGANSPEVKQMQNVFEKMDLDGSNTIDYTEFCAAGLGQKTTSQDSVMWAAFKAFDVSNTGFIEPEDLKKILDSADVQDQWSAEVCHEVAEEIIAHVDKDGDKKICFEDWKKLMEKCWRRHAPGGGGADDGSAGAFANPYSLLEQVSKLPGT